MHKSYLKLPYSFSTLPGIFINVDEPFKDVIHLYVSCVSCTLLSEVGKHPVIVWVVIVVIIDMISIINSILSSRVFGERFVIRARVIGRLSISHDFTMNLQSNLNIIYRHQGFENWWVRF